MTDRLQLLDDAGVSARAMLAGWQADMWTCLPGYITKVDLTKMTCEIQPTIQGQITNPDGSTYWKNMPVLLDCPLVFPKAGGFALTFPVAIGDEMLVIFSSRAIDAWWQNSKIGPQVEMRMHDLSDGFAIPGPSSVPNALASISSTDVQLRNAAGSSFISITAGGDVEVQTPGKVTANAAEADVTAPIIKLTGDVTITGNLTVTENVSITDNLSIGGTTTGAGEGVFLGSNVHGHQHGGVTNGNSKTSPPSNIP